MNPGLLKAVMEKKILDDQIKGDMTKLLQEFKERFVSVASVAAKA